MKALAQNNCIQTSLKSITINYMYGATRKQLLNIIQRFFELFKGILQSPGL